MTNKEVYSKTLCFSFRRLLWDFLALLVVAGGSAAGFLIADKQMNKGLIGLGIGLVIAIIIVALFMRFISYKYEAGQIAMMTRGVTEDSLPEDVLGEGKKVVKERFATVAAYFAATRIIKAIFNQLGRGIESVGKAVGGDTGGTVGSAVSSVIQVIVSYLCDCCLGWVFYRKEIKASKATLEGAVLFFKHGKTLAKNLGRVFGIGLASLAAVGGAFFGLAYLILKQFPDLMRNLSNEIIEAAARNSTNLPAWVSDTGTLTIATAAIIGVIIWAMIHSVLIRPFVLVGVLRNYIRSGIEDMPTEESFKLLDSKSPKFKELHEKAA